AAPSIDRAPQAIRSTAEGGAARLAGDALYSIEGSPVKDVMHERRPVFENPVSAQAHVQKRFRKLLDLLSFESCIGVPIEVQRETHHALFLFHAHQDAFSHYRVRDALAAATLFAALLERDAF